jgi:GNAT superfamily N-acetyltransferase
MNADEHEHEHELVTPADVAQWRWYHDIRRRVLFEARGQIGVYDERHPGDTQPGHHPKLLLYRGDPVGVIRIDVAERTAILRRVAVRSELQRQGHGRALISLAHEFAQGHGCVLVVSHVAPDAVGFYRRCGFVVEDDQAVEPEGRSVYMTKAV